MPQSTSLIFMHHPLSEFQGNAVITGTPHILRKEFHPKSSHQTPTSQYLGIQSLPQTLTHMDKFLSIFVEFKEEFLFLSLKKSLVLKA